MAQEAMILQVPIHLLPAQLLRLLPNVTAAEKALTTQLLVPDRPVIPAVVENSEKSFLVCQSWWSTRVTSFSLTWLKWQARAAVLRCPIDCMT
jgi:hypothetical protein